MITVTPQEFSKAYEEAHIVYIEKSVETILKRTNEEIKDVFELNKKKNGTCKDTVHIKAKNEETLEMLQLAAEEIKKSGYTVTMEDFGPEDMVLVISVSNGS